MLTHLLAIAGVVAFAMIFGVVMRGVHERKKDSCGGCDADCDSAIRKKGGCTTLEVRR